MISDMVNETVNQSGTPLAQGQAQAKPTVHAFLNKFKLVMAGTAGALTLAFGGLKAPCRLA